MLNRIIIIVGLLFSSLALAQNFVCGVDLNGNGDITEQGETASCQSIDNEQFCSIGALTCNQDSSTKYQCSITGESYDNENTCSLNCSSQRMIPIEPVFSGYYYLNVLSHFIIGLYPKFNNTSGLSFYNNGVPVWSSNIVQGLPSSIVDNGITYTRGESIHEYRLFGAKIKQYRISKIENTGGTCNAKSTTAHSCPVSGNSCLNNNGIMQCSPNKCIDLDIDAPVETENPPTMQLDDGTRDANGACMDKSSLFAGRNLSCRKSGVSTAFKNCCKGFDKIIHDNTGSSSLVTTIGAVKSTYQVLSVAYANYALEISAGATAADAMETAQFFAEAEIGAMFDPTSIAISLAIRFVAEFLLQGCNQQDMEVGMLNSSGYCTEVGEYCQKEWKFFGCVQKAKSYCCFNSKMARIIQEQGRPQLGMNWGSSESPNCAGFTPQQFQRLDFSKIDLSEYYNDIQAKADSLIQKNITDSVNEYYKKIGFDYAK
jgi:hypothetical protein